MATRSGDRESYFPAIEKKYGEKISFWLAELKKVKSGKYPDQIAHLRENYGFSQAHANALVMYFRGSKSSQRFETPADFIAKLDPVKAKTVKKIFKVILDKYPKLEYVIAWNQPMVRIGKSYIFGISVTKNYILMAPWSKDVLESFASKLEGYQVNQKTIEIPADWKVDEKLLLGMVKARIAEIKE